MNKMRGHFWAVIDPNWGNPEILLTTIRDTPNESIQAALMTDERGTQMYSGAALHRVPPTPGEWQFLEKQGYKVGCFTFEGSTNL